ncbi:chorismate mutase [Streptomyces sp. NPDC047928]|uniref:chorismate mutase n=1 Tax=unclassified Streptomyces TaxID=2593676 RepID=UPI003716B6F3
MSGGACTVRAVRGATQVDRDDAGEIREATRELVASVLAANDLDVESLVSVFFTMTPDLVAEFPALAAHEAGLTDVPMMCAVEIDVPGVMPRVIRMMAHVRTDRPASALRHRYLRGAAALRPEVVLAARSGSTA